MASYTTKDVRSLDRSSMVFLSLAPATSDCYPSAQQVDPSPPVRPRRSSSAASDGSTRYLKLGPVHWGEHLGEEKEDFHHVTAPAPQ